MNLPQRAFTRQLHAGVNNQKKNDREHSRNVLRTMSPLYLYVKEKP
ncbi:hypothetical protein ENTCAN_05227 [Enterobacter cancerogenus ATCC 35316]|nr:hypothetical protein ENTCAN_05227 [Enterobacter cancerogenus ATCC 35316]